ncbi:lysozyme [Novosphingobium sp. 9]|uniref:lysozyme n=1 Tax=Novosphingobium sp. 9 TaxID=2025349 RepID=UPI0021B63D51|nr:lysozyme [Novosphingobium sp. 9]
MTRTISDPGKAFIQTREGYAKDIGDGRVQAYPDPGTGSAPWTIGWGSTGPDIVKGTIWTRAQAQARFDAHVAEFVAGVDRLIGTAPTTQNQFDAMVSLAYNIGLTGFGQSTVLRKHKASDYAGAAAAFALWNKAGGRVMQGLVNRRAAEAKVYAAP